MATLQGTGTPQVKLEGPIDHEMKLEDTSSPSIDEDEDIYEDAGDLDFSHVQQQLWLSHIPRTLWETLSQLQNDDEIEIGKIRVEGAESNPSRVSLLLYQHPSLANEPKEYNLFAPPIEKTRLRKPNSTFVFSEKDLPGYRPRAFQWDDVDEEGNPGQGRSYLYERHRRERKKKENRGKFVPYTRRPIPKQTAVAGTVAREFEAVPVKNDEYFVLEDKHATAMFKVREREEAVFARNDDPERRVKNYMNESERKVAQKNAAAKKHAQKENRAARVDKHVLIDKLLDLFRQHRFWGLRDLKLKVNQPEAYLREVLAEIATQHNRGDFSNKWTLKDEYKQNDATLLNPTGVDDAPDLHGESDADTKSGLDLDEDDDVDFEDVVD